MSLMRQCPLSSVAVRRTCAPPLEVSGVPAREVVWSAKTRTWAVVPVMSLMPMVRTRLVSVRWLGTAYCWTAESNCRYWVTALPVRYWSAARSVLATSW